MKNAGDPRETHEKTHEQFFGQFRENPPPGFSDRLYAVLEKADSGRDVGPSSAGGGRYASPLKPRSRHRKTPQRRTPQLTLIAAVVAVIVFGLMALGTLRPVPGDRAQQIDLDTLQTVTASNVANLAQVASIGRGSVAHVAWSPDSAQVAVTATSGVYLHDVTGAERQLIAGDGIVQTEYSPDGATLAVIRDDIIELYAIDNGELLRQIEGPAPVEQIVFAPADFQPGTRVLFAKHCGFGGDDRACVIQVWDVATGQPLSGGVNASIGAQMVPARGLYLDDTDAGIGLFDVQNGAQLGLLPTEERTLIAGLTRVSADGETLVAVSQINNAPRAFVHQVDALLAGDTTPVNDFFYVSQDTSLGILIMAVTLSPDGAVHAFSTLSGGLYVAATANGEPILTMPNNGDLRMIERLSFDPASRTLSMIGLSGAIKLRTLPPNEAIVNIDAYSAADDVAFSPDGEILIVNGGSDGGLQIIDLTADRLEAAVFEGRTGTSVGYLQYSADRQRIAYIQLESGFTPGTGNQPFRQLRLRDIATEEDQVLLDFAGLNLFYAPDGSVYNLDRNARISHWQPGAMTESDRMRNIDVYFQEDQIGGHWYTPDGRMLALGFCTEYAATGDLTGECVQSYIQLRDTANTARLTTLPLDGVLSAMAITADGETLLAAVCREPVMDGQAVACAAFDLAIFDIAPIYDRIGEISSRSEGEPVDAQRIIPMPDALPVVRDLVVTPESDVLVLAGDGVQAWALNIEGGTVNESGTWGVSVNHAAFDPGGRLLATAKNGIIHLWGIP